MSKVSITVLVEVETTTEDAFDEAVEAVRRLLARAESCERHCAVQPRDLGTRVVGVVLE